MSIQDELNKLCARMLGDAARVERGELSREDVAVWLIPKYADRLEAIAKAAQPPVTPCRWRGGLCKYARGPQACSSDLPDLQCPYHQSDSAQSPVAFGLRMLGSSVLHGTLYVTREWAMEMARVTPNAVGVVPLYENPQADSAQVLVEALRDIQRGPLQEPTSWAEYARRKATFALEHWEALAAYKSEGKS